MKTSVTIPSLTPGWNIDAWSFMPTGTTEPHPVIVMGCGVGCNKLLGLAACAEEFAAAGYACLVFDYRRWGTSDGTRRNSVDVDEQQDDYRTVIKYARLQPQYDPQRVVIWGFSFAGGHTLTLASEPALNVAASMALHPSCGVKPSFEFNRRYFTLLVLALLDYLSGFLRLPPVYITLAGLPVTNALLNAPTAAAGFASVTQAPSDFPNQIAASIFLHTPLRLRPLKALHLIQRPILLTGGREDVICPLAPIAEASRAIPSAELVEMPGDHFDIFKGNVDWEQALAAQLAFLRKHVPV